MSDENKKIGGIGALGVPYSTTGELKDSTQKLEDWMRWVEAARQEYATKTDERSQGIHDGLKLALARFIVEFSPEYNEGDDESF